MRQRELKALDNETLICRFQEATEFIAISSHRIRAGDKTIDQILHHLSKAIRQREQLRQEILKRIGG